MDKQKAAYDILAAALPLVVFEGWNMRTLNQAAVAAGYKRTDVIRVFPGGTLDAVDKHIAHCDAHMQEALTHYSLDTMKLRQRIALAVRLRIETHKEQKEAARRTLAFLSLPLNAASALRMLYRTVDSIWYAVGDASTDFSFYTKRLSLAAIYSATFVHWLDDTSPDAAYSWEFLERRLDGIMAIGKARRQVEAWVAEQRKRFG